MSEWRADLHTHTLHSDGLDAPEILLDLARLHGLSGLSITDHDTIEAYTPELFEKAALLQISLLPGVEVSSEFQGRSVHILGYGIDLHSLPLQQFLKTLIERRKKRNLPSWSIT